MADQENNSELDLSKLYSSGDSKFDDALDEKIAQIDEVELAEIINKAVGSEVSQLQTFMDLAKNLRLKQDELDIMAMDSLPAAVLTSYLSDITEPNNDGELVSIVAKDPGNQALLDIIYKQMGIPIDKVVYSLLKNGICIVKFDRQPVDKKDKKAANESIANEDVLVQRNTGRILPSIEVVEDTCTVFPILQKEKCVGYIEVTKKEVLTDFNFEESELSYQDVIIHSKRDYAYVRYGVNKSSRPLQLRIRNKEGKVEKFNIDTGHSLLEDAYSAWKTLSILNDSIILASLIKNATTIIVQSEIGNASEEEVQRAKLKLKGLFEGKISLGKQGMRSYISPQSKPNYVYAFTSNNVGAITTTTVGGEYQPGQLYYLDPFINQFFAAMGAPKQNYGYGESAGLDGGGAVEEYNKRYMTNVSSFKRKVADLITNCLNNVLSSRGLTNILENFEVVVYKAYKEDDQNIVQMQQMKLQTMDELINFLGVEDPKKIKELKLVMVKKTFSDKSLIEAVEAAMADDDDSESVNDESIQDESEGTEESNQVMTDIENLGLNDEDTIPSGEIEESESNDEPEDIPDLPPMLGEEDQGSDEE